jgi:asparagine synthase (glutamine-hydrolysing)
MRDYDMCGIAGVFNSEMSRSELHDLGELMINQLQHRGPDGHGTTVQRMGGTDHNLLLAHARLSINDLSESGKQPMSDHNGEYWITFNGEIYNFKELRKELITYGVIFRSTSDTEVLIESYRRWGLDAFKRFVGMWALAIWDPRRKQLVLSRDRFGIKPLYYYEHGQSVFFGS